MKKLTAKDVLEWMYERNWYLPGESRRLDDVKELASFLSVELAPEPPAKPEWWGEEIRPSREEVWISLLATSGYAVHLTDCKEGSATDQDLRTLAASHNARVRGLRELEQAMPANAPQPVAVGTGIVRRVLALLRGEEPADG